MSEEIELLRKIAANTENSTTVTVAIITAASTLFAALFTSWLSYWYAKRKDESDKALEISKLNASVISTERLRWLQDLRKNVSSFYSSLDINLSLLRKPLSSPNSDSILQEMEVISGEVIKQYHDVVILLNPEKDHQKEVFDSTCAALDEFNRLLSIRKGGVTNFDIKSYSDIKSMTFTYMAKLGNETWGQIKTLK